MRALVMVMLGVLVMLSGCVPIYHENGVQTFRQDGVVPGDASKFAVLETEPCDGANCLIIHQVDGKSRGIGYIRRYDLMPGVRKISFKYMTPKYIGVSEIVVAFDAKAGHTYKTDVIVDTTAMVWYPRIIDLVSHKAVSERVR